MELVRAYDVSDSDIDPKKQKLFLVDKLWPRGISKEDLQLTGWLKSMSPSDDLRKGLHSDDLSFEEFEKKFRKELDDTLKSGDMDDDLEALRKAGAKPPRSDAKTEETPKDDVVLVFSAKDEEHNNAVVLIDWLNTQLRG